ncbi:MAG: ADP-forming succinate--CoA ligase subunit beta [Nitrospinae bacterium]|nr:ADP-forming succinate--CoA ligase subunit beta [Nitrospinota bacterium]
MKIHEYQGKTLLKQVGVEVPVGEVANSVDEAVAIAERLEFNVAVVKAQIHAGGRGKGGGVKLAKSQGEIKNIANSIIGMTLVTHQTGPEGKLVQKVLIEEGMDIVKELYASVLIDRGTSRIVFMASEEGGMDIEEVAEKTPEKIIKEYIDPSLGMQVFQARKIAFKLNIPAKLVNSATKFFMGLYSAFMKFDCSLVEINPMVLTGDNRVLALDCKMDIDDNALYRHKDILEYRDITEEDPLELEASKHSLNYIKLDGSIGCMVNGAGLAMATMDIIKYYGAEPANFLDVGGGANEEMIENAFRILLSDKSVKSVLINIFGGILRCDTLASGIVLAAKKTHLNLPVVIRLEGTNAEAGAKILERSGLKFVVAHGMGDAAQKVVETLKN